MPPRTATLAGLGMGVAALTAAATAARAAITTDGTLDPAYGSAPLVSQINVSDSHTGGGGPGYGGPTARPGVEGATPAYNMTPNGFTQLSNAYGVIDAANTLHLFLGGSLDNYDSEVDIAIQSNGTGVSSLAGRTGLTGSQQQITFDPGFRPNALIEVRPTYNGRTVNGSFLSGAQDTQAGRVDFANLAANTDTQAVSFVTTAVNNALTSTLVGAGGAGDPGFAGATTGLELAIPLGSLGTYAPGTPVELNAFVFENSAGALNNQVLAPFSYFADGGGNQVDAMGNPVDTSGRVDPNDYDYTFTGTGNSSTGSTANRQFDSGAYPGLQYFTVAVPEPTGLGLVAAGGLVAVRRRRR